MKRRLSVVSFVLIAVLGALAAAFTHLLLSSDGLLRSLYFWWTIFPVYLHYRSIQLLKRDLRIISKELGDSLYSSAHKRHALSVRDAHYALRGYYLKNAQVLSTMPDMVPADYMAWMRDTQDNVPSEFLSAADAKAFCSRLMRTERNLSFDDVFSEWTDKPLGVASIGQVHLARLRSSGSLVAVKLQFPRMEQRFRADLATLKAFCAFAMPQHVSAFNEIEKNFDSEFDYVREGLNLQASIDSVPPRMRRVVVIPRPYLEYTSRSVLVMEYLDGRRLMDAVRTHFTRVAAMMGTTIEALEQRRAEMTKNKTYRHHSIEQERGFARRVGLMKAFRYAARAVDPRRVLSRGGASSPAWGDGLLDVPKLLTTLSSALAAQFFSGLFNADMHPGNILLLTDGRLGLLDFGQVKRVDVDSRIKYAKLMLALARDDRAEIVRLHFDEIGVRTKYRNETMGYIAACFYHDRETRDIMGDLDFIGMGEFMESVDPMVQLPEAFLLAMRGSLILRGIGKLFGVELRISQMWKDEATLFLKSQQRLK